MNRYSSVHSAVTIVQRFDDYNQFIWRIWSSEEILSAAEEGGQMFQTDEDVRESTSLASSDGSIDQSDVTIR
jgi:hypothetical protein